MRIRTGRPLSAKVLLLKRSRIHRTLRALCSLDSEPPIRVVLFGNVGRENSLRQRGALVQLMWPLCVRKSIECSDGLVPMKSSRFCRTSASVNSRGAPFFRARTLKHNSATATPRNAVTKQPMPMKNENSTYLVLKIKREWQIFNL